ncbi:MULTISPECIES: NAD-dependent epimerase/dehydratase family protein [Bacteroides]|uniref:NAD-dependent epimerase/dehydratase family protein n=1 Tax=Bacteroides TaxID=816 RepID=UPI000E436F78|nr:MULTISPECIES: NAD(P)-dependent oxidoreductase [Bacteroides]RGM44913.1 NAD(P)-dependent oxidoreductase [Bacteroides sp. OM08-11]
MKHSCIITGATGYIGSHLVKYLLEQGWEVRIISQPEFGYANIEDVKDKIHIFEYDHDINSLINYFRSVNAEVVFHLAAAVITDYKPEQVSILIQSNIQFGTEILEAMKYSSTRLFVSTGSYWQNYNSDIYNPVDLYAATKEAFEKILQYYVDAHLFRAITLRLFDVYGEDDQRPKLLNLLKEIAGTDKSIDVSPGSQYLDIVHISDVCSAYLKAFEYLVTNNDISNGIYGVYTGNRLTLKQIVVEFEKVMDKKIKVNWGSRPYKKREVMNPTTVYSQLPNWHPSVKPLNGLALFNNSGGVICKYLCSNLNFAA